MFSEKRIKELKKFNNHHVFFTSLQTDIVDFVEENRQGFEKAVSEYARLKSDYDEKLKRYKDSTEPKEGWIERYFNETTVTEKRGKSTNQKVVYVPGDFPDDPESWFTLFDPFEYGKYSGWFTTKPRLANTKLRSYITIAVLYNQFLDDADKHESIGKGLIDSIFIKTEFDHWDDRLYGQKIRNRIIEAIQEVRRDIEAIPAGGGGAGEKEIIEIKPGCFGISIDLREVGRHIWRWIKKKFKR